jgi:uncharacterized protein with HEPN domain
VSRRDDERVADILDAAREIGEVIELGRDAWDKDRIRQLAVERLLEIIGLRVVLAHHYHRVDPGQVWAIAATEVPRLVRDLRPEG